MCFRGLIYWGPCLSSSGPITVSIRWHSISHCTFLRHLQHAHHCTSFSFFPTLKKCKLSSEGYKIDKPLIWLVGILACLRDCPHHIQLYSFLSNVRFSWGERSIQSCCLFLSKLNKSGVYGYPKKKWLNFWLQLNRRNAIISKTYCFMDDTYFIRSICKKKHVYILKPCQKSLAFVWCEVLFSFC